MGCGCSEFVTRLSRFIRMFDGVWVFGVCLAAAELKDD